MYERFDYRFNIPFEIGHSQFHKIRDWGITRFGPLMYDKSWDYDVWMSGNGYYTFYFVNAADYTMFMLRWG